MNPFDGLTVLVTGTVPGMSRDAATEAVRALGGTPVTSVSSRTGLVVMGEGAGVSKMNKVRTNDLLVITADRFLDILNGDWDTPIGEPVSVFDARQAPDEPDPVSLIPFAERHRVARVLVYPRGADGQPAREIRLSCSCGRDWLGVNPAGEPCPATVPPQHLSVSEPPISRETP